MATKTKKKTAEIIPNQVFVGCPWKTIRPKYERAIAKLRKSSPLSFIIVGMIFHSFHGVVANYQLRCVGIMACVP
jgi:hypothetical protein